MEIILQTPLPDKIEIGFRHEPTANDRLAIQELLAATGFFPAHEIAVALELVDDRISKGITSDYRFILLEYQGQLAGFVCYGAIGVAPRRYDLYWIAVHPRWQQLGFGRKLLSETEHRIGHAQGEIIFIETSSRPQYQATHKFYEKSGYTQVAMIPDYYADQDHRLIFMKRVTKAT